MAVPADAPRSLSRFLLDGERVVVALHRHWAEVAEPVASCIGGVVVAAWLDTVFGEAAPVVSNLVWLAWFVLLGRAIYQLVERRHDWFVATDKRLLLFYGLITQKVAMMPLAKVTDMSYARSPAGRAVGYGEFVLESAGQDQALRRVRWVPDPDANYRLICAEIFGVTGTARAEPGPGTELDERFVEEPGNTDLYAGPPGPPGNGGLGGSGGGSTGSSVAGGSAAGGGSYHGPVTTSGHGPSGEAPAGTRSRPAPPRGWGPGSNPALDPYDDFAGAQPPEADWSRAIRVDSGAPAEVSPPPREPRRRATRDADTGPLPVLRPRTDH